MTAPVRRARYTATDAETTQEMLSRMYVRNRLQLRSGPAIRFELTSAAAGPVRTDRVRFGMGGKAHVDPYRYLLFVTPADGGYEIETRSQATTFGPDEPHVYPIGTPLRLRWSRTFASTVLAMPLAPVADRAAATFGIDAADLRFEAMAPISAGFGRYWRATVAHVANELYAADSALQNPLLLTQATELLANAALAVFPNTALSADYIAGSGGIAPATLRRATAYMEAHAAEPLTVGQIAAAAGVGARALHDGFRRHFQTTPMARLRRIRLENAHRQLQAADPTTGATVAGIAAAWGFGKPGRFATQYRRIYGVPPSHTLRI
ncbi:MAG TPA: AraC family transcriptional regulator [Mycobacteriales bacterium]|nr:AraC family transcriptional regulator [Mycobacteriales bacterium]